MDPMDETEAVRAKRLATESRFSSQRWLLLAIVAVLFVALALAAIFGLFGRGP